MATHRKPKTPQTPARPIEDVIRDNGGIYLQRLPGGNIAGTTPEKLAEMQELYEGIANHWHKQGIAEGFAAGREAASGEWQETRKVEIIPGGFIYKGKPHDLSGAPLTMLRTLVESWYQRLTADHIREALELDDATVTWPQQRIIDIAKELRAALRKATGLPAANPLPATGKGKDLGYKLDLP
jgi:hypothetical protein